MTHTVPKCQNKRAEPAATVPDHRKAPKFNEPDALVAVLLLVQCYNNAILNTDYDRTEESTSARTYVYTSHTGNHALIKTIMECTY